MSFFIRLLALRVASHMVYTLTLVVLLALTATQAQLPLVTDVSVPPTGVTWGAKCGGLSELESSSEDTSDYTAQLPPDVFQLGNTATNIDPWITADSHCSDPFTLVPASSYLNRSAVSASPALVRASVVFANLTVAQRETVFALEDTVVTFSCWHSAVPDLFVLTEEPSDFNATSSTSSSSASLQRDNNDMFPTASASLSSTISAWRVLSSDDADYEDNGDSMETSETDIQANSVNLSTLLSGSSLIPALPATASATATSADLGTTIALTCRRGRWYTRTHLREAPSAAAPTVPGAAKLNTVATRPVVLARCPAQCGVHPLERALPPHMRLHYSSYAVPSADEGVLPPPEANSVRASPAASAVLAAAIAAATGKLDGVNAEDLPGVGGGLIDGLRAYSDGAFAHVACRNAATSSVAARPLATYQCHASPKGPGEWRLISSSVPATLPASADSEPTTAALQTLAATLPIGATVAQARVVLVMCAVCLPVVCDGFPESYTSTVGLLTTYSLRPVFPGSKPQHLATSSTVNSTASLPFRGRRFPAGTVASFSCPLGGLPVPQSTLPAVPAAMQFECRRLSAGAVPLRAFGDAWCGYSDVDCGDATSVPALLAAAGASPAAQAVAAALSDAAAAARSGFRRGAWVAVSTGQTLGNGVGLPLCVPSECQHMPQWAKPQTSLLQAITVSASTASATGLKTEMMTTCPAYYVSLTPNIAGTVSCVDGVWTANGTSCRQETACVLPMHQPAATRLKFLTLPLLGLPTVAAVDDQRDSMPLPWRYADETHYPLGAALQESCSDAGESPNIDGAGVVWRSCGRGQGRIYPQLATETDDYAWRISRYQPGDMFYSVVFALPLWNNVTLASSQNCNSTQCPTIATLRWAGYDPVSQLQYVFDASTATTPVPPAMGSSITLYCTEPGYESVSSHTCNATARWVPPLLKDLAGADTLAPCPRRSCRLPLQHASSGALESEGAVVTLSGSTAAVVTEKVFTGTAVVDQSDPAAPRLGDTLGRLGDPRVPVKVAPGTTVTVACKPGYAAVDQYDVARAIATASDSCADAVHAATGLAFAKWASVTAVPSKVPAYTGTVPPDAIPSTAMKNFYCKLTLCPAMTIALARQLMMLPGAGEESYTVDKYQFTYPTPTLLTGVGSVKVGVRSHLRCAPGYAPSSVFATNGVPALFDSEGVVAAQCVQTASGAMAQWTRINASVDAAATAAWTGGAVTTSPVVVESMLLCEKIHPRCSSDNGLTGNPRFDFGPPSLFNASEIDPAPFSHYNSVMVVKCRRRFVPASSRLTCNADGEWIGTLPTCVSVVCGAIPIVSYSGLRLTAQGLSEEEDIDPQAGVPTGFGSTFWYYIKSWPYGVKVFYMCAATAHQPWARFTTPEANKHVNITCEHDGVSTKGYWTKVKADIVAELSCTTIVCDDIAASLQGYVISLQQPTGSTVAYPAVNSHISLQCPAGTYGGQSYLVCAADGSWRGEPPNCTSRASCPALALDSATTQPLPVEQGGETLTPQFVQVALFTDAINITGGILHSDSIDPATVGSFEMGTVARYSCATDAPTQFASSVAPLYRICDGLTGRWTWAAEAAAFSCVAPRCPALSTIMSAHHAVLLATPVSNVTYSDSTMKPASAVTGTPGQSVYVRCRNPSRPSDLDWVRVECDLQTRLWKYNVTALPLCLDLQCARPDLAANMTITAINGAFTRPWTSAPTKYRDTVSVGSAIAVGCAAETYPSPRSPRSLWMHCEAAGSGGAGAVWTNSSLLASGNDDSTTARLSTGLGGVPLSAPEFRCMTCVQETACLYMGSEFANLVTSTPMKIAAHTYPLVGSAATLTCVNLAQEVASLPEMIADNVSQSSTSISRRMLRMRSFSALSTDGVDDPLSFRASTIYCSPQGAWTGVFPTCGTAPPANYTGCGVPPLPASTGSAVIIRASVLELPIAVSAIVNPTYPYPLGAQVHYTCASGYVPLNGAELHATCQARAAASHTAAPQWVDTDGVSSFSCVRPECPLQPSFNGSIYITAVVSQVALGGWSNPMLVASSTGMPLGTVLRAQCREGAARALGREHDEISWTCVQNGVVAEWVSTNAGFVLGLCVPTATAAFASCEIPDAVANAIYTLSAHNGDTNTASYPLADSVITYECKENTHLIEGTLSRQCMSTGTWSGTAPVCSAAPRCLSAASLFGTNTTEASLATAGVEISYSKPAALDGSLEIMTVVAVSCLATDGAIPVDALSDNSRQYECIEETSHLNATLQIGVWRLRDPLSGVLVLSGPLAESAFQCIIPQCADLLTELLTRFVLVKQADPTNTTRAYPQATSALHLSCALGYEPSHLVSLTGPSDPEVCPTAPTGTLSTLRCMTDAQWHGAIPLCVPVQCPHVTETVYEVNAAGDVVATHHVLPAGSLLDPDDVISSEISNPLDFPYTECDLGELCLLSGTIDNAIPAAVGSFQTGVAYPAFRSVLNITCPSGYKANITTVECASNGKWYGMAPTCSRVLCDVPPATPQTMIVTVSAPGENGAAYSFKPANGYPVGARATYSCRANTSVTDLFALAQQTLTCSERGVWQRDTGATVTVPMTDVCLFSANCPPLPVVIPFIGTQIETTATYDEDRELHPIGTFAALGCRTWFSPVSGTVGTLNCTAAGWAPYAPSTASVSATLPVVTASSVVSSVRMTAQAIEDAAVLQCEPTTQCPIFSDISGGSVSYSDSRVPDSYAMPMCSSQSLKASATTALLCTGIDSSMDAALDNLTPLDDERSSTNAFDSAASLSLAPIALRSIAYAAASLLVDYQWNVSSVNCVPRYNCGLLPVVFPVASISYSSLTGATQLTLETVRAYPTCVSARYVPVENIVCGPNGWSTETPCVPVQCPDPLKGVNGTTTSPLPSFSVRRGTLVSDTYGSGYTVGTTVIFSCPASFVLRYIEDVTMECLSTGLWSSSSATCQPYVCYTFLAPIGQKYAPDPATGIPYDENRSPDSPGKLAYTKCYVPKMKVNSLTGAVQPGSSDLLGKYECVYARGWVQRSGLECTKVGCGAFPAYPMVPIQPTDISSSTDSFDEVAARVIENNIHYQNTEMFNAASFWAPSLPKMMASGSTSGASISVPRVAATRSRFRTFATVVTVGSVTIDEFNDVITFVEPRTLLDSKSVPEDVLYDISTDMTLLCPMNSAKALLVSPLDVIESEDSRITRAAILVIDDNSAVRARFVCTLNDSAAATVKDAQYYQSLSAYDETTALETVSGKRQQALRTGAAQSRSAAQSQALLDSTFNTTSMAYWSPTNALMLCIKECSTPYNS